MKYVWTYVDARGKWYLKSKSYYSFGSTLHKVLERFYDAEESGVQTVGDALRVYEESWIDAGYGSAEEMQEAYGEGKQIIEDVLTEMEREPGVKTLAVEKLLKLDLGDFTLIGRIDRIDEHPDGRLEVIDYKSGRSKVTAADVESDLAMACYQLLLREAYPDREVFATIIALRAKAQASASIAKEDLEVFRKDIQQLGSQIISTGIEDHVPAYKSLCPDCDFLALCKKHPNFEMP